MSMTQGIRSLARTPAAGKAVTAESLIAAG